MAIFNAPLPQNHHAFCAVRSAWKIHEAVELYQRSFPQETWVGYSISINTGLVAVGIVGLQERLQSYTAIGDVVNVASYLENIAPDNTIIVNDSIVNPSIYKSGPTISCPYKE